ncbi:MAG: ribonucleoside-diphosphate reductase subunit alpha [Candidatus Uhrbacteria bacterium]
MKIESYFCPTHVNPFDTVKWEKRTASIPGSNFKEQEVEAPVDWSQNATNIVASKYFYGAGESRETSVKQLIHRVTSAITKWGTKSGYMTQAQGVVFEAQMKYLLVNQYFAFNSPVWFNVGLYEQYGAEGDPCNFCWDRRSGKIKQPNNPYERPQVSACFIQRVEDTLEDIMQLAKDEALLFKYGSGTGTNVSTLRSCRETLTGGGTPSGPLSFMRIYDQVAEVVTSGGRTRRAAIMRCMDAAHPDIMEFVTSKADEDRKARMLISQGIDPQVAYRTVMYQNANLSVRLPRAFFDAVKEKRAWNSYWVTKPDKQGPSYDAAELLRKIAECAWQCGDPGVQYDDEINNWHTTPAGGRIRASNPCSEFMAIDDTACNLASINLMKFRKPDGSFDHAAFVACIRIVLLAQEIMVDWGSYPTAEIAQNSHDYRFLGLGYTNLGALLMSMGLAYDSHEAREFAAAITSLMQATAFDTSADIAEALSPFEKFHDNANVMLGLMISRLNKSKHLTHPLKGVVSDMWQSAVQKGHQHGYRNAQCTVLAPTGTISFMMDCDTTGIEPDFSLVKTKMLVGGGTMRIVNQTLELALKTLGYESTPILAHVESEGNVGDLVLPEHKAVFQTSIGPDCIPWQAHVKMMAAVQPYLCGAISKTVNFPSDATVDDIMAAYIMGNELGLKALAIYRDGSKAIQPLETKKKDTPVVGVVPPGRPKRMRLPDTRDSTTHRFSINGHNGYFTVGLYPDGSPGEIFISMAKEGSTLGGLLDCFGIACSIAMQYGVPLEDFCEKFEFTRFDPQGMTNNPDIRFAKSIVDYIFRWMRGRYLGKPESSEYVAASDAPVCSLCGSLTVRAGTCHTCPTCGSSTGCG